MPKPRAAAELYAKNLQRLATFYAQVARMSFSKSAKDYVVLESESFQLVVVQIPKFFLEGIADVRAMVADAGGELNPMELEWIFDGNRVCDGHDPEGNVFQLRQIGPR
jgi:predicted enzyme related to lactoylglutathione lyase